LLTLYSGYVVDAAGEPVPGATIAIVESSVPMPEIALLADENGRFVLRLPPGRFVLRAHGPGGTIGETAFESQAGVEEILIEISPG